MRVCSCKGLAGRGAPAPAHAARVHAHTVCLGPAARRHARENLYNNHNRQALGLTPRLALLAIDHNIYCFATATTPPPLPRASATPQRTDTHRLQTINRATYARWFVYVWRACPACGQAVGCGMCSVCATRRSRSSGVAPRACSARACTRVCWCRRIFTRTHTYNQLIKIPKEPHTHTTHEHEHTRREASHISGGKPVSEQQLHSSPLAIGRHLLRCTSGTFPHCRTSCIRLHQRLLR